MKRILPFKRAAVFLLCCSGLGGVSVANSQSQAAHLYSDQQLLGAGWSKAQIATMRAEAKAANACNPCNPCAAKACNPCTACNPCAAKACNPCAACSPCNPCATKACNPCAACNPCNPCAAKACNPCAACNPCNPRAAKACNPCAAKAAPVVSYSSVFDNYNSFEDIPDTTWIEANDAVGRIGGWRAYARQVQAEQKKERMAAEEANKQ